MSRDEEHWQGAVSLPESLDQLVAIHPRHSNVRDDRIEGEQFVLMIFDRQHSTGRR